MLLDFIPEEIGIYSSCNTSKRLLSPISSTLVLYSTTAVPLPTLLVHLSPESTPQHSLKLRNSVVVTLSDNRSEVDGRGCVTMNNTICLSFLCSKHANNGYYKTVLPVQYRDDYRIMHISDRCISCASAFDSDGQQRSTTVT